MFDRTAIMRVSPLQQAHVFMLLATTFYGINYGVAKLVMPQPIPPFGFIFMRSVGATLCFWVLGLFFTEKRPVLDSKKDLLRIVLCGILGACTNMLLFFKGLSMTSPVNASLMVLSTPLVVALISYLTAIEAFKWHKAAGLIIGLGGALCFVLPQSGALAAQASPMGDLLVFLNAVAYGLYIILARPLLAKYNPITVIKWVFLAGCITALPFTLKPFLSIQIHHITPAHIGEMAFVVLGATVGSYALNILALKHVKASLVGYYTYLQPLIATLFAVIVFDERLGWMRVVAGIAIFVGVYLTSHNPKKRYKHKMRT